MKVFCLIYSRPPDDYVPGKGRPWEVEPMSKNIDRAAAYHQKMTAQKFFNRKLVLAYFT